jgi:hypothetical protein
MMHTGFINKISHRRNYSVLLNYWDANPKAFKPLEGPTPTAPAHDRTYELTPNLGSREAEREPKMASRPSFGNGNAARPRRIRIKCGGFYFLAKKEGVPHKYQIDGDLLGDAYDRPVIALSIGDEKVICEITVVSLYFRFESTNSSFTPPRTHCPQISTFVLIECLLIS